MPFQRAYKLTIGTTEIDASTGVGLDSLRIAFRVERDATRVPNAIEVQVWNLARETRESLGKATNVPVQLEAGYVDDGMGVLFLGDLRTARSTRDGADIITKVAGGDGETAIRTASLKRTFPKGTPVGSVLTAMAKALGIKTGNVSQFATRSLLSGSAVLNRSLTVHGPVYDELERLCRSCGLAWSIQDSALELREEGAPVGTSRGPLLTPDSGLIGEVEVETEAQRGPTDPGKKRGTIVSGVCLLRSDLVPGRSFAVSSTAFTGNLVCLATTHVGDSHAENWYVEFSGRPY